MLKSNERFNQASRYVAEPDQEPDVDSSPETDVEIEVATPLRAPEIATPTGPRRKNKVADPDRILVPVDQHNS